MGTFSKGTSFLANPTQVDVPNETETILANPNLNTTYMELTTFSVVIINGAGNNTSNNEIILEASNGLGGWHTLQTFNVTTQYPTEFNAPKSHFQNIKVLRGQRVRFRNYQVSPAGPQTVRLTYVVYTFGAGV